VLGTFLDSQRKHEAADNAHIACISTMALPPSVTTCRVRRSAAHSRRLLQHIPQHTGFKQPTTGAATDFQAVPTMGIMP
jgi:hypothetical protein